MTLSATLDTYFTHMVECVNKANKLHISKLYSSNFSRSAIVSEREDWIGKWISKQALLANATIQKYTQRLLEEQPNGKHILHFSWNHFSCICQSLCSLCCCSVYFQWGTKSSNSAAVRRPFEITCSCSYFTIKFITTECGLYTQQYEASRSNFLLAAVNSRRRIENVMCVASLNWNESSRSINWLVVGMEH